MRLILLFLYSGLCCWAADVAPSRTDPSPSVLRNLVERSDLVVEATPEATCQGYLSEGPVANGVTPTPQYNTFYARLKVDQVLKGNLPSKSTLWINYTVQTFASKDPPKPFYYHVSFDIDRSRKAKEVVLPGSPVKGVKYIFFLEDRPKHDPKSSEACDGEQVIYRTFDLKWGMLPFRRALASQISGFSRH